MPNKKIYLIILTLTLGLFLLLEYSKPKQLNWFPSYATHHKIPYGTYVVNQLMVQFFPKKTVEISEQPIRFLTQKSPKGTYLFVNQQVAFGETELDSLLHWTAKGNTLIIASQSFEDKLLDTLKLSTATLYSEELKPTFTCQLSNPNLQSKDTIILDKGNSKTYFKTIDTLQTVVISIISKDQSAVNEINGIIQPFGKGTIILSTLPEAFTNYFILKDNNHSYTSGLLTYIDNETPIYVDAYYKSGKSFYTSPMYIFLNNKPLKWAYYIAVIGCLLFIFFEGRRKQRAIPIRLQMQNQTVAFTKVVADMYFDKKHQHQIAIHKITYFKEYIRSVFNVNPQPKNTEWQDVLAQKTHHTTVEIQSLFEKITVLENKPNLTNKDLLVLNRLIEQFKHKAHGK